jgi:phospholipid/cholesterol/gamma-HCH transport system ATP-binding protein
MSTTRQQQNDLVETAETDNHQAVVHVKDLKKSFGSQKVLNGVTFDVERGENFAILGKSGSGKSVSIKCLVGLEFPDSGEVKVLGQDIRKLRYRQLNELRKKIGFLFQSGALYDSLSVKENLAFPLRKVLREYDEEVIAQKVEEVLDAVGLADAIDKMPSELSGGMKKRIGLARTLIMNPEIFLYDEPTTGLDPVTSQDISQLIVDIQKRFQTTSIIITHDMNCVRITANRVAMLRDGKIYVTGTVDELEQSNDEWIKDFFKQS